MPEAVRREWRGDVLVGWLDNPPVNASNAALRSGVMSALDEAIRQGAAGVVLIGEHHTWVAGSDLTEFSGDVPPPLLPAVIEAIEQAPFPVVAALDGYGLGGGLELALGCDRRVGTERLQIGLPEVGLGMVPGAGGTQRLPRLTGRALALQVIALGRRLSGTEALRHGVIDAVAAPEALVETAVELARATTKRPVIVLGVPADDGADDGPDDVAALALRRGRGRPQVVEAIRLVQLAGVKPATEALADERETFTRLRTSPEAAALRHLFFAGREAGRTPARADRSFSRVGVLGAGTMGCGIAKALMARDLDVVMVDTDPAAIERARGAGIPSSALADDVAALAGRDLVIEAVFEDPDVKRLALASIEAVVDDPCVIATNTSYLDLDQLAARLGRPERFIGLHFFAPADRARLVEVVAPATSTPEIVAAASAFVRGIGKQPVVTGVYEGFVGNRILQAYRRHAEYLLEDGCLPDQVDRALVAFGFAMGPFAVADLSGLQIAWSLRRRRREENRAPARDIDIPDTLCERGWLGRRVGRGYYRYVDGQQHDDPEVAAIVREASTRRGIERREIGDTEIVERCVGAMVVAGAQAVADGTAARPGDVDVAMTEGLGFPKHHGGPLWWAAQLDAPSRDRVLGLVEVAGREPVPRELVEKVLAG